MAYITAEFVQNRVKLKFGGLAVIHALCLCLLIVFLVQFLQKKKKNSVKVDCCHSHTDYNTCIFQHQTKEEEKTYCLSTVLKTDNQICGCRE